MTEKWRKAHLKEYGGEEGLSKEMQRRSQLSSKNKGKTGGFASMDEQRRKEVASLGGSKLRSDRKLSDAEVRDIRSKRLTPEQYSDKFLISTSMVSLIQNKKRYGDVQ